MNESKSNDANRHSMKLAVDSITSDEQTLHPVPTEEDEHGSPTKSTAGATSTRHRRFNRGLLDDTIHLSNFKFVDMAKKVASSLQGQRFFLISNLLVVVAWSCLCAWAADEMHEKAANDPDGRADQWLGWLDSAGSKFRLVGILFVFALVFRFNRCYDRWVQGRVIWGQIISCSLDLTRMTRQWMADEAFADRFSRFVIVCGYTAKAMLRGNSIADPINEAGEELIEKGYLTREELEDMDCHEGWQPQYCLDMLSAILIEAHYPGDAMMFDPSHKVHSQLFRGVEAAISKLGYIIGDAIRVQSSSLPPTYDGLHDAMFYFYFTLGPIFFAPTVGWALPFLMGCESLVIMFVFLMGSELIQPFGLDKVDLPLELFCQTIEKQVKQIDQRGKRKNMKRLARTSVAYPAATMKENLSNSLSRKNHR